MVSQSQPLPFSEPRMCFNDVQCSTTQLNLGSPGMLVIGIKQ